MLCVPTAQMATPPVQCNREKCSICGVEVWVDAAVLHDDCVCTGCVGHLGISEIEVREETRETLHALGWNDAEINACAAAMQRGLKGRVDA